MADDDLTFSPSSPLVTTPAASTPGVGTPSIDIDREIQESLRGSREAIGDVRESMRREQGVYAQRERALEPLRERQMELAERPLPQRPQMRQTQPAPQRNDPGADENWLIASMLLGSLAGAFTRNHVTNALGALTGAINGYQEGSRQKFDQNMQIWEAEHKRAVEANQQALDEYRGILEDRKLTNEQATIELQLAAQKFDDQAMATAARTKNSLVVAQLYDKQVQALEQLKTSGAQVATQRRAAMQAEAQAFIQSTPDITEKMRRGDIPPPSRTPRDTAAGYVDRLRLDILSQDPNFQYDLFDRKQRERRIPIAAEQAGATAAARTSAVAGTNIELVMRAAGPVIENAAEKARAVPATAFPALNRILQTASENIGDPALRDFQIANLELAEALARAMNPRSSVIAVATMNRAIEYLSTADSPEAYDRVLRNISRFVQREFDVVGQQRRGEPIAPINIPDSTQRSLQPTPRQFLPRTGGTTGVTPPTSDNPTPTVGPPGAASTEANIPGYSKGRGLAQEPIYDPFGLKGWKLRELFQ